MSSLVRSFLDHASVVARFVVAGSLAVGVGACIDPVDETADGTSVRSLQAVALDGTLINVARWATPRSDGSGPAENAIDGDPATVVNNATTWSLVFDQEYDVKVVMARWCLTEECVYSAENVRLHVGPIDVRLFPKMGVSAQQIDAKATRLEIVDGVGAFSLQDVEVWVVNPKDVPPDEEPPRDDCPNSNDFDHDGFGDACDTCPYQYNPDQGACATNGGNEPVEPPAPASGSGDGGCSAGGTPPGGAAAGALITAALALFAGRRRRRDHRA